MRREIKEAAVIRHEYCCDFRGCEEVVRLEPNAPMGLPKTWGRADISTVDADNNEIRVNADLCPKHIQAVGGQMSETARFTRSEAYVKEIPERFRPSGS